jgi:hypothetical protein
VSVQYLAVSAGPQACVELVWRRGSKGLQRARFVALRIRPAGVVARRRAVAAADRQLPVCWLLAEWPVDQPEPVRYWLSNLPEATPLVELVRLGKLRWRIEHDDRELKGALAWTTSRGVRSVAGTTTSPWSRSRTASLPWSGCVPQIWWRRPDVVAAG